MKDFLGRANEHFDVKEALYSFAVTKNMLRTLMKQINLHSKLHTFETSEDIDLSDLIDWRKINELLE